MAAHKCVINVTASVLPDHIRHTVGGTATHNLNDTGDNNVWLYHVAEVGTTHRAAIDTGVGYMQNDAGATIAGTPALTVPADDDIGVIIIKHTGLKGDGTTKTATDSKLYINTAHGTDAGPTTGSMYLLPGEVWWGRFAGTTDLDDISLEASTETINAAIYDIVDDGGI